MKIVKYLLFSDLLSYSHARLTPTQKKFEFNGKSTRRPGWVTRLDPERVGAVELLTSRQYKKKLAEDMYRLLMIEETLTKCFLYF